MRVRKDRAMRTMRSLAKPSLAGAALISYASGAIVAKTANARQYYLCQLKGRQSLDEASPLRVGITRQ